MPYKTLEAIVAEKPFTDYHDWWLMGSDFIRFMSQAIYSEWCALPNNTGNLATVTSFIETYIKTVFHQESDSDLANQFVHPAPGQTFYSGEFDAISYAFYRSAFELIAEHISAYEHPLEVERRRFTERVGAKFFQQVADHIKLSLPDSLESDEDMAHLKAGIQQVGSFLEKQGYLRDNFDFRFEVSVEHKGQQINQAEADVIPALRQNKTAYALYEMGYPVILPSAVYLYNTIGEAQHHSSRTIEELFKRVGFIAYETDNFDPTGFPSDSVIELWEIRDIEMLEEVGAQRLIPEIREAFQNLEYPGDDNIVVNPKYAEPYEMKEAFKGKAWFDVDSETIITYRMSLIYFTPEAFCYYLPTFMIADLQDHEPLDIGHFVFLNLIPSDHADYQAKYGKLSLLDEKQKKVTMNYIHHFLTYAPSYLEDCSKEGRQFWNIK